MDDETLQKKLQKYTNLNQLEEEDFPCFLTIKSLIVMVYFPFFFNDIKIDGALSKPFFSRNSNNEIICSNSMD